MLGNSQTLDRNRSINILYFASDSLSTERMMISPTDDLDSFVSISANKMNISKILQMTFALESFMPGLDSNCFTTSSEYSPIWLSELKLIFSRISKMVFSVSTRICHSLSFSLSITLSGMTYSNVSLGSVSNAKRLYSKEELTFSSGIGAGFGTEVVAGFSLPPPAPLACGFAPGLVLLDAPVAALLAVQLGLLAVGFPEVLLGFVAVLVGLLTVAVGLLAVAFAADGRGKEIVMDELSIIGGARIGCFGMNSWTFFNLTASNFEKYGCMTRSPAIPVNVPKHSAAAVRISATLSSIKVSKVLVSAFNSSFETIGFPRSRFGGFFSKRTKNLIDSNFIPTTLVAIMVLHNSSKTSDKFRQFFEKNDQKNYSSKKKEKKIRQKFT